MIRRHLSMSKLGLLPHCLYVARPDVQWPPEAPTADATRGTARHSVIEAIAKGEEPDPEAVATGEIRDLDAWRAAVQAYLDDAIPFGAEVRVEVALAYDRRRRAGRVLPSKGQRDYSKATADETPGTADLLIVVTHADGQRTVTVVDFKTGAGAMRHVDPPESNLQLHGLALAAALAFRADHARAVVAFVGEDGNVIPEESPVDLDRMVERFAAWEAGVESAHPTPGAHCARRYCPLSGVCPATADTVAAVVRVEAPPAPVVHPMTPIPQNPEHAAYLAAVVVPALRGWLKRAEEALPAYAREHGGSFPVGEDSEYREVVEPGHEAIELTPAVLEALRAKLGDALPEALSVSKKGIEEAAVKAAPKRKGAALARDILGTLREQGAIARGKPRQSWQIVPKSGGKAA